MTSIPSPPIPEHANLALLAAVAPLSRERARAEAAEWAAMVAYRDAEVARISALDRSGMFKRIERSGIAAELGLHAGMSAGQVEARLAEADRLRAHTPSVWQSFEAGLVDAPRAREIAAAASRLERPESCAKLDATVVEYASTHTVAQLRQWLRRFVTRVESDLAIERANAEREKRRVDVTSVDDGMAYLNAYLPAHEAAAVATRLRRAAKAARAEGDERTQAQLEADLLVAWALTADDSVTARGRGMAIDIAVRIDAAVAAGADDGHAESADGRWEVPVQWLLSSALAGSAFWHRLLMEPFTDNTLAHDYPGYQPPSVLRRAIVLRDGVCAAPGCLTPAAVCELDHREPWPDGTTSGGNLDPGCKGDHARKSHGMWERIKARVEAVRAGRPIDADDPIWADV